MNRGQAGQDLLKKNYEVVTRDLRQRAPALDGADRARALELADMLERMYASEERGAIVFRDRSGAIIDTRAIDTEVAALLGEPAGH